MKMVSMKCVVLCVVLSLTSMASAASWTGGAGPTEPYWDISQNWSSGTVPSATDGVNINNVIAPDGVTVLSPIIDEFVTNAECTAFYLGSGASGSLEMIGGKLTVGSWFQIGVNGGTGVFNLSGGEVVSAVQSIHVGQGGSTVGTINMTGGSIAIPAANKDLILGNTGSDTGMMNMDGGTVTVTREVRVGGAGKGHLRMAGGQIDAGTMVQVPNNGDTGFGKLELFGGTIKAGTRLLMRSAARSFVDISGGTLILGADTGLTNYLNAGQITAFGGLGTVNVEVVNDTWVLTGTADPAVMAKAWQPSPADTDTLFGNQATLAWVAGKGAETHKVYLGAAPDALALLTSDPNQGVLSVDFYTTVTDLDLGTTYYWRVDEIAADASVTTGDVWSFATLPLELARPVYPVDGATGVEITDLLLQWEPGLGALNHDVYFGNDAATLALVSEDQTEPNYPVPEALVKGMTYYWRIDEFDGTDTHTGLALSFKTSAPAGTTTWTDGAVGDSLWSNPDNWNAGLPGIGTKARIVNDLNATFVDANTAAYCTKLELGWDNANANCLLEVEGGSLTIEGELLLARMLGGMATLGIRDGVVNAGWIRGWHGDMWIDMTGGELNVAGNLEIPRAYAADVGTIGVFKLHGGVARADQLTLNANANVVCNLDITEGMLILNGDKRGRVNGYIASGLVTAYDGTGSISMVYDPDTNKTIVIACSKVYQTDFNGDCVVDTLDRDLLMSELGYQTPAEIVWDFDMSTDPVGTDPYDLKIRSAANGEYSMTDVPGTLRVLGALLLDEQMNTSGLWDTELHFVARALSETPLNLWVTVGTSATPSSQAYVGLSLSLDTGTNTQTLKIWNGSPPHVPPFEAVVVTGLAADAMVDITVNYDYDKDTFDWTATDGTLAKNGTAVPYAAFNGGNGGNFTIQGVDGTSATIDQFTFKILGSDMHSPYDLQPDGVVDQLDLDILESEMGN